MKKSKLLLSAMVLSMLAGKAANAQCLTAPFTESFDSGTQPSCVLTSETAGGPWIFNGITWNTDGCSATPGDHTGNGGEFASMDHSGLDTSVVLEFDTIDVSGITNPYLTFYYFMCGSGYSPVNALYIETFNGTGWVTVDSIKEGFASWTEYSFDLTGNTFGTNYMKIRFRSESGGSSDDFYGDQAIDDISLIQMPSCLKPTALNASNVAATSVDLDWVENNSATSWAVEYGTAGFTPGTGTSIIASSNPYALTGLTQLTTYDIYVRAICTPGDTSDWSASVSISTPASCPGVTSVAAANVTFNSAELSWTETGTAVSWQIEYGTTGFAQGTGTTLVTGSNPHTLAGINQLTDYDFYIRSICAPGDTSGWSTVVSFTTPPSCPWVTAPTASNLFGTSADLSWTENGSATEWEIEWGPAGFTIGSGTVVITTNNPHALSGLSATTDYEFYVRAICAPGDTALHSSVGTFATPCLTFVAPYSEDFENAGSIPDCWTMKGNEDWQFDNTGMGHLGFEGFMYGSSASGGYFGWVDDSSPNNTDTELESPYIDVSGLTVPRLTFYTISDNEGETNVDFHVDVYDGSIWIDSVYFSDANTAQGGWEFISVDLSGITFTGPMKVRFVIDENNGTVFDDDRAIDDVVIEETPSCLEPTALQAISNASGEADLSWTENGTAASWQIEYGPLGFAQGSGTTTIANSNPFTITGLTGSSNEFYVRAICSPGDTSAWSTVYGFCAVTSETISVTECVTYTVPSGNATYTTSGIYNDTISNVAGCDSLLTIDLTINSPSAATISEVACESYTVPSGTATYTTSGTYADVIPNAVGCDSVITIDLTINNSTTELHVIVTCDSFTVPSGSATYYANGIVSDTIPNAAGCDSIMTFAMTIYSIDPTVSVSSAISVTSNESGFGTNYQWLDCNNGFAPIAGETDQDFTASANGSYAVEISNTACLDTSICTVITEVGIENLISSQVQIYPNPANGDFNIDFGTVSGAKVKVTNVAGQVVYFDDKINTSLYPVHLDVESGMYSVIIRANGQEARFKLIIE